MNKLATIEKIHSFREHPNADNLICASVKAWPVVVKKNEFTEGQLIVFITIDSVVPETEYFEFMRKQKFRIWNARFRGSPSSGLVCPLSILHGKVPSQQVSDLMPDIHFYMVDEGDDVSEILGITKYEKPLDLSIRGDVAGGFPTSLISISDEDNMLSNSNSLQELEGKEIYITQKVDGSSTTFIFNEGEFKACSRRLMMKENSGFAWIAATKYNLKWKMTSLGRNLAIQAESVGNKLNGNRMGIDGIELRIFRAKNLDTRELYNYQELKELSKQLEIPIVDEIMVCQFNKDIHTIDWFKNLADNQIYSTNGQPAEGLVVAPTIPEYSNTLGKSWSLKIINSSYKQS